MEAEDEGAADVDADGNEIAALTHVDQDKVSFNDATFVLLIGYLEVEKSGVSVNDMSPLQND